ncbi:hypothetical protein P7K49_007900 [Saguinus oedipus]|uniref:Rab-GAP TBC domain-containing protein n=1 Tax=Saguinus oedipus TaxID=9490 RepID=A0ABQ9VXT5_SAGOE|nr:hypothetical protein P7K49_007900 [Saguinus oedipus]
MGTSPVYSAPRAAVPSIQPVYGAQHPPLDPRLTKKIIVEYYVTCSHKHSGHSQELLIGYVCQTCLFLQGELFLPSRLVWMHLDEEWIFIKERSKVNAVPLKNKKASSFHEFARNTSDAWDIGDDEEEDFSSPSFQTLNSKVALVTAAQVLENHSKLRVKPERSQSTTSDVPANYKVIKSSSDAQLSRNSSDTCLRNPLHKQQSLPLRPIIPLVARISDQNASGAPPMTVREKTRLEKFRQLLSSHNTDLAPEAEECSSVAQAPAQCTAKGVRNPEKAGLASSAHMWISLNEERADTGWPEPKRDLPLAGYLPANTERRKLTLQRKREEYFGFIEQYYDSRNEEHHQDTYRQDESSHSAVPATTCTRGLVLFSFHLFGHFTCTVYVRVIPPLLERDYRRSPDSEQLASMYLAIIFERILFIWAIRHPASGYVQGINDLVTPFFVVFLSEYVVQVVVELPSKVRPGLLNEPNMFSHPWFYPLTPIFHTIQTQTCPHNSSDKNPYLVFHHLQQPPYLGLKLAPGPIFIDEAASYVIGS